nr:transmembrane and TPR repeat-containing protein 1 [Meriones unguiculatus]
MRVTRGAHGGGEGRRRRLVPAGAAALLAGASCLCYGRSLRGEFVHDDVWAIVNNPDVRPGAPLRWAVFSNDFWGKGLADGASHKSYRPLCVLSFRLNIFLTGMDPFYFHAVNVVLHCLVTFVLMYTCEKTVFKSRGLAFLTALLFAVHPVHTEAVAGIVGRADVLACLLFLLAFLSYHRSLDWSCEGPGSPATASPFFLLLSLLLGTCAMLVKETGVTVFGVCLLYDLFSPSHRQDELSNGVTCQHSLGRPGSPQPASQQAHPHRESRKQRVPPRDAWGGCHSPLPATPRGRALPVSPRALWSLMRRVGCKPGAVRAMQGRVGACSTEPVLWRLVHPCALHAVRAHQPGGRGGDVSTFLMLWPLFSSTLDYLIHCQKSLSGVPWVSCGDHALQFLKDKSNGESTSEPAKVTWLTETEAEGPRTQRGLVHQ